MIHEARNFGGGPIQMSLVGVGGNGSQMLTGLARMDRALRSLGGAGLNVTVFDPDLVSEANVGRQLFYRSDVGINKAIALTNRVNAAYQIDWNAVPTEFGESAMKDDRRRCHVLITCVDSAAARRSIHKAFAQCHTFSLPYYWLDLGNRRSDGQVVLGQPKATYRRGGSTVEDEDNLPTVVDVFPQLLDASIAEENAPSCSVAEALESQDLFINDHVSRWALHLLWMLFRSKKIEHHGYFINLQDGTVNPLPVPALPAKGRRKKSAAA